MKEIYYEPLSLVWSFSSLFIVYTFSYVFSLFKENTNIVDLIWSFAFIFKTTFYYFYYFKTDELVLHKIFFSVLLILQFTQNLTFKFLNLKRKNKEHKRYQKQRMGLSTKFIWLSFFTIFLFQFLVNFTISHLIYGFETIKEKNKIYNPTFIFSCILISFGLVYSFIGNYQLYKFKNSQTSQIDLNLNLENFSFNNEKCIVLNKGLYLYCRFPNFFGEGVVWFGVFLANVSAEIYHTILCLLVLMLYFFNIVKVENINYEKFPEEVKKYIRTTSPFFPWWKLIDKKEHEQIKSNSELKSKSSNSNLFENNQLISDEEISLNRK